MGIIGESQHEANIRHHVKPTSREELVISMTIHESCVMLFSSVLRILETLCISAQVLKTTEAHRAVK